jgi:quercetin dioxygenase-like cupin family protein
LRIKYEPGEKSVMHSHPESIGLFLTDAHIKFTYPDGRTEGANANPGSVLHIDACTHLTENTSSKPFEAIQVELKR